ncbi:MAG: phosphoribosylanthranilate isomerase [Actinomycetota bacterium]|nr:phosphoribosylanthranilate isomerase [Actinomycetota bacterium]
MAKLFFGQPRVKICCIASVEEVSSAIQAGASMLGLVSAMPSGPGVIPDDNIAEIARRIPPGVESFLLTSSTDVDVIIEQHRKARTTALQIVDRLAAGAHDSLRRALPGIRVVQVVHVTGYAAIEEARALAHVVDAVTLDSGNADPTVRELGATGRTHDWSISRMIRDELEIPVILAGGLNSTNVREAIRTVQPYGIDVCTGVRDPAYKLDVTRLRHFMKEVRMEDGPPTPASPGQDVAG